MTEIQQIISDLRETTIPSEKYRMIALLKTLDVINENLLRLAEATEHVAFIELERRNDGNKSLSIKP